MNHYNISLPISNEEKPFLAQVIIKNGTNIDVLSKSEHRENKDTLKNKQFQNVTNIMLRYKLTSVFKERPLSYYNYTVEESQRPDNVPFEIYGI